MTTVSGIEIRTITVNKDDPIDISVIYDYSLHCLIDITATLESGIDLGRAILNDANPNNDILVINNTTDILNKIVWLKIVIHHPRFDKYDFKILITQNGNTLTVYDESNTLSISTLIYEGFIAKS